MKKLTKIKLINWHFFDDQEFEIVDNCVLYGENGCGKSTVIDAIHYVLSGGTCKFNKAANSGKSARTVYTYMKARVGADEEEYARNSSNVITHIALEFYDTSLKKPYIFGVVLQITVNQQPTNRFYVITNQKIENSLFYADEEKTKIRNGKNFFENCKNNSIEIETLDNYGTNKTCSKNMNKFLEVPSSYTNLLEKAISFADLGDIDSFAREFLFEEDQINSSDLEQAAENYKMIKSQLEIEQLKDAALEPLYDAYTSYSEAVQKCAIYSYITADLNYSGKKVLLEKAKIDVENLTNQEEQLLNEQSILSVAKDEAIENLSRMGVSQEEEKLRSLRKEEEANKASYEKDCKNINEWFNLLKLEKNIANSFNLKFDYESFFEVGDYTSLQNLVRAVDNEFKSVRKSLYIDEEKLEKSLIKCKDSINDIRKKIEDLNHHINSVPALNLLENYIKEECLKNGIIEKDILMLPLCDALEINDDDYRDAIEGLLGVYRFDLLVPKSQFNYAFRAFFKHPELKGYFGFGVVRDDSLFGKVNEASEDSIIKKINCEASIAEPYLNYLIGDYKIVEGENFKANEKGINKDGLIFDGVAIRRINADDAATPYIGRKSYEIRKEKLENELKDLNNEFESLNLRIEEARIQINLLESSKITLLTAHEDTFFNRNTHKSLYELKKKQADELERSDDLLKFEIARNSAREEKDEAIDRLNSCNEKLRKVSEKRIQREKDVENISNSLEEAKKNRDDIANNGNNDFLKSITNFDYYTEGKSGDELYKFLKAKAEISNEDARVYKNRIVKIMNDYNRQFDQIYDAEIENVQEYLRLYWEIHQNELPKRLPEVTKAKDEMERLFKEDFASKLIDKISEVKEKVKTINRILAKHKFGTDQVTFQFKAETTNKEQYKAIAKILNDQADNFIVNQFLMNSLDAKQKEAFETVFQVLIGNKSGENIDKQIHEYCDYRNYLDYDIKEISLDGVQTSYKKNQRSKSGGETQTPFYVMIAAAFNGSISVRAKQNSSSCCLVILDEAFNNMDEERITEMLNFYNDLDIQLIISVPTNRAGLIIGKMGTQVAIIRQGTIVVPYITYSPVK